MTTFDEREQALEEKFVHDEELRFRITARRDKLLAQWAATRFGLAKAAELALISNLLAVRGGAGHDDGIRKEIATALVKCGHTIEPIELGKALHSCEQEALKQVMTTP